MAEVDEVGEVEAEVSLNANSQLLEVVECLKKKTRMTVKDPAKTSLTKVQRMKKVAKKNKTVLSPRHKTVIVTPEVRKKQKLVKK